MKKVALYFVLATLSLIIALVSSGLILNAIYTYQAQNPAAPKVEQEQEIQNCLLNIKPVFLMKKQ